MKRFIYLALAAAIVLLGCTKNEVVPSNNGTDEITFSSYAGREVTKATTFDGSYKVRAFYKGVSYFEDTFVNGEGTYSGTTSTKYYWPTDISASNKMKFYAASPASCSIAADSTITNFTATGAVDLLVAKTGEITAKPDGAVPLHFSHALSQINKITLQGKAADGTSTSEYTYTIDSLSISGKKSGTYSFGTSAWTAGSTDSAYVYATKSSTGTFTGGNTKVYSTAKYLVPQEELTLTVRYKITKTVSGTTYTILGSTTKTDTFTVAAGTSYALTITLPNDNESSKITFNATVTGWGDDQEINIPQSSATILSGVFTVSKGDLPNDPSDDIKVRFSRGNLYWDGSAYKFEKSQLDAPTTWDPNHVGHLFWVAYTDNEHNPYDESCSISTYPRLGGMYIFCGDYEHRGILQVENSNNLFCLSKSMYEFITGTNRQTYLSASNSLYKNDVTINGITNCRVYAPDDFSGTINDSYTLEQWQTAEKENGLVCFRPTSRRIGTNIYHIYQGKDLLTCKWYLTSTLYILTSCDSDEFYWVSDNGICNFARFENGAAIRLVQYVN